MSRKHPLIWLLLLCVMLTTGCAMNSPQPYDYTALMKSKPRSIVVIPPMNNSVEVNAPYIYLSTITRPLAERGYYVFPVSVIDHFMKENGLPTPAEMNTIPLDKIDEIIGADAVLYVSIEEWGQSYRITTSAAVVTVSMKLVDVKTGVTLWEGSGSRQQSSGDGGGGLIGALIGALVTQVLSSSIDHTPTLSRNVNNNVIYNDVNGLLAGPYAKLVPGQKNNY